MNAHIDNLADRHFRPDPHGALADPSSARQARVLVAISGAAARTKSGQDALWMLTNLLCRQFKLVTAITFDIPAEIEMLARVAAFGEAPTLRESVMNCVRLVAGQYVGVDAYDADQAPPPTIEIFIGQPPGEPRAEVRLVLFADGWRLFLGSRFSRRRVVHLGCHTRSLSGRLLRSRRGIQAPARIEGRQGASDRGGTRIVSVAVVRRKRRVMEPARPRSPHAFDGASSLLHGGRRRRCASRGLGAGWLSQCDRPRVSGRPGHARFAQR